MARLSRRLGWADWAALAVAIAALCALWSVQLVAVPAFAAMFDDFGGTLPRLTRMVMVGWVAIGATLITGAGCAGGLRMRMTQVSRAGTVVMATSAGVPVIAMLLTIYAVYMPIFEIADAVR